MRKNVLFLVMVMICLRVSYGQKKMLWKFETADRIYSTPVVESTMIFFGSGDGHLYALELETGKLLWKYKTEGKVHSSPYLDAKNIFFSSTDGSLYCLNKADGTLRWKFKSEGEKQYGLWDYYLSSPQVNENIVYWGSGDKHVYAIDVRYGQLIWKYKTDDVVHADSVVYKESVYIGSFDGHLYKLNKYNGALIWKFKTIGARYFPKGEIQRGVSIHNDLVYFGSRDYNLYVVDTKTGTGVWNYRQPRGWIISTPKIHGEHVYFGSSDGHMFYCYNINTSLKEWEVPTNMRIYSKASSYKDEIIFSSFDGKITSVNHKTGKFNWVFQTEASKKNYHKIFKPDGTFLDGFDLYGKDYLESEKMIHDLGSILSDPVVYDDKLYFGSSDGNLYAVLLK
ncbi:PQQ-binding-like beta-propeller repeat protein [Flagellimonas sp.]|uniref:outer membrane protein assembly factor BamB family protein n=1 Tax=Flagellimonas sp. TaxID=2058762 RepID=UPI003F49B862